jgi:cytochrome c oxidase subunit 4
MAGHQHGGHSSHGLAHTASVKMLLIVFVTLILLTILTVVTAGKLGPFGTMVALSIATVKGLLVCLFFMHMWWDKPFNILVFFSSFFFVSLFIGFTLMDTEHYQNTIDMFPRQPEPTAVAPTMPAK